jgi:arylsulfatase A-like enzyme
VRRNALFILIDSLRNDVVSDLESTRFMVPNLARIAERGFSTRVVANAQATQFVMPSLFSLTYPLDHGGYNNGIRERPASFVECFSKAGYTTNLVGACNAMGISLSYDRDFDTVHTAVDYRNILTYRIEKTLAYELSLIDSGEKTESEALAVIATELGLILDAIPRYVEESDTTSWPARLLHLNLRVAQFCKQERLLLKTSPEIVLRKLRSLPPALYWRCLGKPVIGPMERFCWRVIESVSWRFRRVAVKYGFPIFPLGHFQVLAKDLCPGICELLTKVRRPWFMYIHFMDAHDSASLSRPLHLLLRLKYLPRWLRARRNGWTNRTFLYDSALMFTDEQVGSLITTLEQTGQLEETIVLVTGDHGNASAGSPRRGKKALGHRTHFEDIDVGLVVSHGSERPRGAGLLDTMGVTATLLELLNVKPHCSFKGRSAFGPGRWAVVSENAGRGNADIERRDLFFTITSRDHKLMVTLVGSEIGVNELYDLNVDPLELNNRIEDPAMCGAIDDLLATLFAERGDLLASRGVAAPTMPCIPKIHAAR